MSPILCALSNLLEQMNPWLCTGAAISIRTGGRTSRGDIPDRGTVHQIAGSHDTPRTLGRPGDRCESREVVEQFQHSSSTVYIWIDHLHPNRREEEALAVSNHWAKVGQPGGETGGRRVASLGVTDAGLRQPDRLLHLPSTPTLNGRSNGWSRGQVSPGHQGSGGP